MEMVGDMALETQENLIKKRQSALKNIRARRLENRKKPEDPIEGNQRIPGHKLEYFFKLSEDFRKNKTSNLSSSPEIEIREISKRLLKAKQLHRDRERQRSREPLDSQQDDASAQVKHYEFIKEIFSDHFRNNMKSWLSNDDPDPGLSSSSLEELESYKKNVQYRYNMLKAMAHATQMELENLDVHIRAVVAAK